MNARQFHNALACLRFIDGSDLAAIGMPDHKIRSFMNDPFRGYMAADDERQAKIWAIVERQLFNKEMASW